MKYDHDYDYRVEMLCCGKMIESIEELGKDGYFRCKCPICKANWIIVKE